MHLERHWLSQVVRQNLVAHSNTMPRASDKAEKAPSKERWVEKPGGSQRRICFSRLQPVTKGTVRLQLLSGLENSRANCRWER